MKHTKIFAFILAALLMLSSSACSSVTSRTNIYSGYEYRVMDAVGYGMVNWSDSRTRSFEEFDAFYRTEPMRSVIIKVKTANKKVEVDHGTVPKSGSPDRWTCPQLVLTKAKVTEIFFVNDEFEYSLKVGDTIWLASEYIVLDQYKLILLPGSPIGGGPTSVLYLPNTEYLLYATLETLNEEPKYKGDLPFSSISARGVIALEYSSS